MNMQAITSLVHTSSITLALPWPIHIQIVLMLISGVGLSGLFLRMYTHMYIYIYVYIYIFMYIYIYICIWHPLTYLYLYCHILYIYMYVCVLQRPCANGKIQKPGCFGWFGVWLNHPGMWGIFTPFWYPFGYTNLPNIYLTFEDAVHGYRRNIMQVLHGTSTCGRFCRLLRCCKCGPGLPRGDFCRFSLWLPLKHIPNHICLVVSAPANMSQSGMLFHTIHKAYGKLN